MYQELEKLTLKVARIAEHKFLQDGGLHPYFYGVQDDGKRFIFDPIKIGMFGEDVEYNEQVKTAISHMVQMLFAAYHVKRYVYVSEAWTLRTDGNITKEDIIDAIKMGGVSFHPKRIEVLAFQAEDINGAYLSGCQSIIRPAGGNPYLDDDLQMIDASRWETTGCFTHLLEFRKHMDKEGSGS